MLALVTCREARPVDTDLPLLQRELPDAVLLDWDDGGVDWSALDVIVLRSPWDYHRRRDEFLAWAASVSGVARLWNPIELLQWNTDKRYLGELAQAGVPSVPTSFLVDVPAIDRFERAGGFAGDVVVKPTVGASASGVVLSRNDPSSGAGHARTLLGKGLTPMVQPYLRDIESVGETALVYLGGEFSHGVRRRVVLQPADGHGGIGGQERSEPRRPSARERSVGDAVIDRLPDTAYARIDLLPTPDGPVVLEVEVTEPSLFLHLDEGAPARAAAAFRSL